MRQDEHPVVLGCAREVVELLQSKGIGNVERCTIGLNPAIRRINRVVADVPEMLFLGLETLARAPSTSLAPSSSVDGGSRHGSECRA